MPPTPLLLLPESATVMLLRR